MPTFLPLFSAFSCKELGETSPFPSYRLRSPSSLKSAARRSKRGSSPTESGSSRRCTPSSRISGNSRCARGRSRRVVLSAVPGECGIIYFPPSPFGQTSSPPRPSPTGPLLAGHSPLCIASQAPPEPLPQSPGPGGGASTVAVQPRRPGPGASEAGAARTVQSLATSRHLFGRRLLPAADAHPGQSEAREACEGRVSVFCKQAALTISHWFAGHALG